MTGQLTAPTGLAWTTPTIEGHKAKLDQWCQTVGPALFSAPEGSESQRNGRILVVDWNVNVGNGNIEALIDDLKTQELSAGRGEPDFVFLLQEAFRRGADVPSMVGTTPSIPRRIRSATDDIHALARKLDWWMFYVPSMRNGEQADLEAEDRGNAILSSLPLEALEAIELPFSIQRRVAIAAVVHDRSRALSFRVTAMHLDTRAPLTRGFIFGAPAARDRQAKWVAETVNRFSDDGLSLIVGGDLNSYWGSFESSVDTLASVAPRVSCGTESTHTTGFTLDHIFARLDPAMSSSSCRRANDRFDSDHYPLVLPLETPIVQDKFVESSEGLD